MLAMQLPFSLGSKDASVIRTAVTEGDTKMKQQPEAEMMNQSQRQRVWFPLAPIKTYLKGVSSWLLVSAHIQQESSLSNPSSSGTYQTLRFKESLCSLRKTMRSTVLRPFRFRRNTGDQIVYPSTETQRNSKKALHAVNWDLARMISNTQRLTKSVLLRDERRKRLMAREEIRLRAVQESQANCSLQEEAAMWLTAQKQSSAVHAQRQQQSYGDELKVCNAEYQTELADIVESVNGRPLLLKRHLQRRGKERQFSLILERAGMDEALRWSKASLEEPGRRIQLEDPWEDKISTIK
ncbi:hypothetical protein DPEC_G00235920 [Dallia pectoralis]|uniref:Uncharacterized protein n=1 Tax=Dallia pectoralis TaxID=75939 RepID=A0ACC2FYA1_DALPE|nr:hypothetical protein DPEC_G00235920 [Dallia pectoralis]